MKDKLTLRLERRLIQEAKKLAHKEGTSVSQMVSDYFKALQTQKGNKNLDALPPKTASISGVLKKGIDEAEYKRHLEEKYL